MFGGPTFIHREMWAPIEPGPLLQTQGSAFGLAATKSSGQRGHMATDWYMKLLHGCYGQGSRAECPSSLCSAKPTAILTRSSLCCLCSLEDFHTCRMCFALTSRLSLSQPQLSSPWGYSTGCVCVWGQCVVWCVVHMFVCLSVVSLCLCV